MPCSTNTVSGGQWEGEIPAPENVEIIAYLDAVRPVPSDEQYIPLLEFDVITVLQGLCSCGDAEVRESGKEVVESWKEAGKICGSNRHIQSWREELGKISV